MGRRGAPTIEFRVKAYRPQRSCGKVMFSQASVILFTGVCVCDPVGRHSLPGQTPPAQTPTWADIPQTDTPWLGHPPWADTPSPETATAAGGMHPTGMHSCLARFFAETACKLKKLS